ncbi:MAG TPA: hypothetical protein VH062_37375 [Polyangiaceae bacterium]|jgi:hypothetical protein|nr:hypothetical protein [Polyangiaceae bacterium]
MTDGDRRSSGTRSGRALIWAAGALVLVAGLVLVAVWPRSEKAAVVAKSAEESTAALPEVVLPMAPTASARPARVVPSSPAPVPASSAPPLPMKDFFASDAPESLRKMHDVTSSGGMLPVERMKELYQLGKDHPGDARPHLLMAEDAMNRGWDAFAVSHYERAAREDASAREDPRMLKDLVDVAGGKREPAKAASALSSIYGGSAASAVEAALAVAGEKGDEAAVQRLAALSAALRAKQN